MSLLRLHKSLLIDSNLKYRLFNIKIFNPIANTITKNYSKQVNRNPRHSKSKKVRKLDETDELVESIDEKSLTFGESDVIKCTKDQWLYKPTPREINLFLDSKPIPTKPFDLENSVVIKLIDLDKDVTSPVKSTVYFSEYGIRKGETKRLCLSWIFFTSVCTFLGFWQLRRRKWKELLIKSRQESLNSPKLQISSLEDIKLVDVAGYRVVEASGVLDSRQQFLVGPRQALVHEHGNRVGYNVIYPLRFPDGSAILVNLGWIDAEQVFDLEVTSELVKVRGVLVPGEISENLVPSLKYKLLSLIQSILTKITNRPFDLVNTLNRASSLIRNDEKKVYRYLDPESIGSQVFSKEPEITRKYLINVYDSLFDNDTQLPETETEDRLIDKIVKISRLTSLKSVNEENQRPGLVRHVFQRKQKSDYLLFYADPDTHLNYAIQWFLIASSISAMFIYKLFRINRVLKMI